MSKRLFNRNRKSKMCIRDRDKVTFKFTVTVKPEVKLGAYKNLDIKKDDAAVSDEDVEAELTSLQERFADLVIKEEDVYKRQHVGYFDEWYRNKMLAVFHDLL